MQPTLRPARVVVAFGWHRTIAPGCLVMVHHEGIDKVKRVQLIEGNKVYILGDNPGSSTDSRHFGWVETADIIAKVIWPR